MLGFWGENLTNVITGIGSVTVNSSCSPIVTLDSTYNSAIKSDQLSTGAIIGIVIGCFVVVAVAITVSVALCLRKKR